MFDGPEISWWGVIRLLVPLGFLIFLIGWILTKIAQKRAKCLLTYPEYYGEEMERHKHRFILRREEGEEKDIVKEILEWIEGEQNFLILAGEGGIGKSRACIEAAKKRKVRLQWINLRGYQGKEEILEKGLEEVLQKRKSYVFENCEEQQESFGKISDIILKKKAKLITITREPGLLIEELERRSESPLLISLGKMENLSDMIPFHDPILHSQIAKISEGIPAITRMAIEQFQTSGTLRGIEDRYGLLNSVYLTIQKRMPDLLPLLGKMALVKSIPEKYIQNKYEKDLSSIRKIMSAGQIVREKGEYRIQPESLSDYIAREIYFEPEISPRFESTIEEFLESKARNILTTIIHLGRKDAAGIVLKKSKQLSAKLVIELGLTAYEGFKDRELIVKYLGEFWNRVWELKDPDDYNAVAILLHRSLGEWEKAETCWNRALELYGTAHDEGGLAQTYHNLGIVYQNKGEWERSNQYYGKSLRIKEKLGDSRGMGQTFNNLGNIYRQIGNFEKAQEFYEKSLGIFDDLEDIHGVGQTYCNLGNIFRQKGEFEHALNFYEKSLEIFEKLGDSHGMAQTYGNIGIIYRRKGNWNKAIRFNEKDLAISEKLGDIHGMAQAYNNLGIVYRQKGNFEKALEFYEKSFSISRKLGDPHGMGQTQGNMGILYKKQGKLEEAEEQLLKACEILKKVGAQNDAGIFFQHLQDLISRTQKKNDDARRG
jgi:tetratricopeptide (TPR) repeat protein